MSEKSPNILNKSKTYLLPYFNEFVKIKFLDRLSNTYISFNNEYRFCLRYNFTAKPDFMKYEGELEKSEYYKETIDLNKNEVLYVFEFPDELFDTLDLYVSGKYSYLPNKNIVIDFLIKNFGLNQESKIIKILNRDKQLKEELEYALNVKISDSIDLSSPPILDNENFDNPVEKE